MRPEEFHRFTDRLVERARSDERIIGLVALGSTAATDRLPDEWSDHDVWFVTPDGVAAEVRDDATLLPDHERVVVRFGETEHGRSVVYDDGHLVEYAVFDVGELHVASANAYAVLHDGEAIEARMHDLAAVTAERLAEQDPTGDDRFGWFCSQLIIGVTRAARGEVLSSSFMIRGQAVASLAWLLGRRTEPGGVLDGLDPHRRFEQVFPDLAAEIERAIVRSPIEGASALLDLAERELIGSVPAATSEAFVAVRRTIERARAG